MIPTGRCAVCHGDAMLGHMCAACARSYDRWNATARDDLISLVMWAAGRARRAEARRTRDAVARLRRELNEAREEIARLRAPRPVGEGVP